MGYIVKSELQANGITIRKFLGLKCRSGLYSCLWISLDQFRLC